MASMWLGLAALAMIGVGAHEAASGPWTLLALPGAVLATLALIRTAIVGPRSTFFQNIQRQRRTDRPRSVGATRAWVVFGAVLTAFGGGLAIAAALPARPSVDVDVVAVAYGGDRLLGAPPDRFGLAVRNARCSHGATDYAVAIAGKSLLVPCSASAGGALHTVTVGLSAGHTYPVTITPLERRAGQSQRTGSRKKLTFAIPSANSNSWQSNPNGP